MCLVVAVTSVTLSLWLMRENRRMEREGVLVDEGDRVGEGQDGVELDVERGRRKHYRYVI